MAVKAGDVITFTQGPFGGEFDASDPGASAPNRLFDALNMVAQDTENRGPYSARHGFLGLPTALGSGSSRRGQCLFMHHALDGTSTRYLFAGGKMYIWDGTDGTMCCTDVTPGGLTLDTSNPVFAVTYNNELILSDEHNKPWVYTPSTGAIAAIDLNTAGDEWTTKDGPTVYSGKVMFIVQASGVATITTESADGDETITTESADGDETITTELTSGAQNMIVYCEELDVRTGYLQDGFVNSLVLAQSSSEVLTGLSGEESALMYWRAKGMGVVTGKITTDFQASSTKDTLSTTVGTNATAAHCSVNGANWFLDLDGRVYRAFASGGQPQELWYPVRREIDAQVGTSQSRAMVAANGRVGFHEGYGMVLFTIWDRHTLFAFDARSGAFISTWSVGGPSGQGIYIDAMGSMLDSQNRATFMILGSRTNDDSETNHGIIWREKHTDDSTQWLDQANATSSATIALTREVQTHWITRGQSLVLRFTGVSAQFLGDAASHAVSLRYVVPSSGRSNAIDAQTTAVTGDKSATDSISTARWALGPNAQGTACRIILTATHSDNVRWGVHSIQEVATVRTASPASK